MQKSFIILIRNYHKMKNVIPLLILCFVCSQQLFGVANHSVAATVPYSPLLEAGKIWKYNMHYIKRFAPKEDGTPYRQILGSPLVKDGIALFPLYYAEGDNAPDTDNCVYLWEDCEAKKVYQVSEMPKDAREEIIAASELIYDFADPLNSEARVNGSMPPWIESLEKTSYTTLDDECRISWSCGETEYYRLTEGIGFMETKWQEGDEGKRQLLHCDLLWGWPEAVTGDSYAPALYEVTDGEGNIIYSLPEAVPGYFNGTVDGLDAVESDLSNITVYSDHIAINSGKVVGEVEIVSASGTVIRKQYIPAGSSEIAIGDLSGGIYVLRAGADARKFAVK